jgi:thiamine biosynthesis protein ThiS
MEKSPSCAESFNLPEIPAMQVQINGETRELKHNQIVLAELVRELALAPQRIAVEVNKRIVRRAEWEQTNINEGDRIEIVHFVGGGSGYTRRTISHQ